MARRKNTNRFDLHEALNDKSYDHAVICTFTFDAPFFEDYCLDRFNSLSHNQNITVLLDRSVYEKTILGAETHKPKTANIRYLLHPISVPGVFHPKLFLLVSKNKGRLIIGSANFTRPGITSNAELVGCYDYEAEKNESFKPLFQAAFAYLTEIGVRWHGNMLISNLQDMAREALWLDINNGQNTEAAMEGVVLLNNLEAPLLEQIVARISAPVETIYVLSRYFDSTPRILDKLREYLHPGKIKIFTQNGITNLTPDWLKHPSVKDGATEIYLCRYADEEHAQPLHAKAIIIEAGKERFFAFGSANFTTAALLKTARTGNAEMLMLLSGVHTSGVKAEQLFDPDKTAVRLKDEAALQSLPSEDETFERTRHDIRLFEAMLNGDRLNVRADVPSIFEATTLQAMLSSQNGFEKRLTIAHQHEQMYTAEVSQEIKKRLGESSTTIHIESYDGIDKVGDSNVVLVTNLLSIENDKPVRRERHIKEAQQSAAQFFAVLSDLLQGDDDQALLTFLSYCNISVGGISRAPVLRHIKPTWDGGIGMRSLGERNLKVYLDLHQATLDFFDRHFRRLQRHVALKSPEGIANFMHIFLAMGGVLRAQMERITQGLESKNSPLTTTEWFDCRNGFNVYFGRFKLMMDCLWKDYLSPMLRQNEVKDIKEQFSPDIQPLHDLYTDMYSFRERIERLRTTKLAHRNVQGEMKVPNYFDCVLSVKHWTKYAQDLKTNLAGIEKSVA
jgi:HKD family nuclease